VSEDSAPARPALTVVRGDATPEELAALIAVLAARGSGAITETPAARPRWGAPGTGLRRPLRPGPGAWAASALPQ
jgi:hypothetical protein